MRRCLQLARQGVLGAPPNPMVGAVLVFCGRIIGEGYHVRCGEGHAEVNCFASVAPADAALVSRSTLYVSLEPCAHYGRTPPCARLIVEKRVPRVVVGCEDPFAKVHGRGIQILRDAGIQVTVGVLEQECRALNRKFFTFHTLRRPYVLLKWACSSDGFLDRQRRPGDGQLPLRISTPRTSILAHRLRTEYGAILVGHRTLRLDRPRLTSRAWYGPDPQPVVLGHVGADELPDGWLAYADVEEALRDLHERGVQSLLVEGGAHTLQGFIDRGLWDEAREERAATPLGGGIPAPCIPAGVPRRTTMRFGVPFSHWVNPEPHAL